MESENAYAAPRSTESPAPVKKKKWPVLEAVIVVVVLFLLAGMLLPAVGTPRHVARRSQCRNNIKQIALAIHNYESANGHLPPAHIADENGKPMHSWRVLILPQLDQQALFDRYDMDEPWDGPNNSKLHDQIVQFYRCPSSSSNEHCTDYVLITGPGTGFEGDKTIGFSDITDGTSNTVMATEIANSKIHWMQPQDISLTEFLAVEKDNSTSSNHRGSRHVAKFDGSTYCLPIDSDPNKLKNEVLIADGEVVNIEAL